jgi:hypothetical protein
MATRQGKTIVFATDVKKTSSISRARSDDGGLRGDAAQGLGNVLEILRFESGVFSRCYNETVILWGNGRSTRDTGTKC